MVSVVVCYYSKSACHFQWKTLPEKLKIILKENYELLMNKGCGTVEKE